MSSVSELFSDLSDSIGGTRKKLHNLLINYSESAAGIDSLNMELALGYTVVSLYYSLLRGAEYIEEHCKFVR